MSGSTKQQQQPALENLPEDLQPVPLRRQTALVKECHKKRQVGPLSQPDELCANDHGEENQASEASLRLGAERVCKMLSPRTLDTLRTVLPSNLASLLTSESPMNERVTCTNGGSTVDDDSPDSDDNSDDSQDNEDNENELPLFSSILLPKSNQQIDMSTTEENDLFDVSENDETHQPVSVSSVTDIDPAQADPDGDDEEEEEEDQPDHAEEPSDPEEEKQGHASPDEEEGTDEENPYDDDNEDEEDQDDEDESTLDESIDENAQINATLQNLAQGLQSLLSLVQQGDMTQFAKAMGSLKIAPAASDDPDDNNDDTSDGKPADNTDTTAALDLAPAKDKDKQEEEEETKSKQLLTKATSATTPADTSVMPDQNQLGSA